MHFLLCSGRLVHAGRRFGCTSTSLSIFSNSSVRTTFRKPNVAALSSSTFRSGVAVHKRRGHVNPNDAFSSPLPCHVPVSRKYANLSAFHNKQKDKIAKSIATNIYRRPLLCNPFLTMRNAKATRFTPINQLHNHENGHAHAASAINKACFEEYTVAWQLSTPKCNRPRYIFTYNLAQTSLLLSLRFVVVVMICS